MNHIYELSQPDEDDEEHDMMVKSLVSTVDQGETVKATTGTWTTLGGPFRFLSYPDFANTTHDGVK
jgi:hypothetical protein